jgi:DNA-binding CsgD family transcriptional regulator
MFCILILGMDEELLYCNADARKFFNTPDEIPVEVRRLCRRAKAERGNKMCYDTYDLLCGRDSVPYSLRAFLLGRNSNESPTHVLILIEKVVERREANLRNARTKFGLSRRELQIAADVAQGLSIKKLGARLFISEYTVKDHLKKIMQDERRLTRRAHRHSQVS